MYAGNSCARVYNTKERRDHPRVCGEQYVPRALLLAWWGSSPRVRGTVDVIRQIGNLNGIIPACAGNSRWARPQAVHLRDHPRVCGEQEAATTSLKLSQGSSPRVRGTVNTKVGEVLLKGIIPACAGNRPDPPVCAVTSGDHPRVCGEQMLKAIASIISMGSSPRVRGTVVVGRELLTLIGIIPACAGNREEQSNEVSQDRDHPRVCGEQRCLQFQTPLCLGSSPRVRGTAKRLREHESFAGIIPACAGNSCRRHMLHRIKRDHPRVCGEQ